MRMILLAAMVIAALAAENPWAKVMELKSGGEVRILKAGSPQPLLGTLDEAREDNVVVVVKNEEIAIPRDQILRLDYRTRQTGKHVTTKESGRLKHRPIRMRFLRGIAVRPPHRNQPLIASGRNQTSGRSTGALLPCRSELRIRVFPTDRFRHALDVGGHEIEAPLQGNRQR